MCVLILLCGMTDAVVVRRVGVAHARQHVRDRVGHRHGCVVPLSPSVSASRRTSTACGCLPAGLGDAGQLAGVRHLADADAAQPERAEHRARTAAAVAAGVAAHLELRLARRPCRPAPSSPCAQLSLNGKPSARSSARPSSSFVGRGDDGDVHAARAVDLVVVDLVEDRLLGQRRTCSCRCRRTAAATGRGSRGCAAARPTRSRSRNSHMRSPRRVTLAPIGMPSRSLNCAMDLRRLADQRLLAGDRGEVAHARRRSAWRPWRPRRRPC